MAQSDAGIASKHPLYFAFCCYKVVVSWGWGYAFSRSEEQLSQAAGSKTTNKLCAVERNASLCFVSFIVGGGVLGCLARKTARLQHCDSSPFPRSAEGQRAPQISLRL